MAGFTQESHTKLPAESVLGGWYECHPGVGAPLQVQPAVLHYHGERRLDVGALVRPGVFVTPRSRLSASGILSGRLEPYPSHPRPLISALIDCVPNFSEGRDLNVIREITARIESVVGATLMHVDPGKATNRTVVTFAEGRRSLEREW